MTLEEIKQGRESGAFWCQDEVVCRDTDDAICWLIAEVEMLHKEGMTIYAMMEDGRAKAAAKRCAEIAYRILAESRHGTLADKVEKEIREEFNL